MTRKKLFREALCGLLIGLFLIPAQPAQAFPVFDAAAYGQRVKSELKRVQEWVLQVQQHAQLYLNAVNQLTTLRGVLQTVDKELAKNLELARLTNDISEIIRGSYKLKRQVENQTRYPEQDLLDFEEYLLHSMGRNSKQTIQQMTRTANADALVRNWIDEKQGLEEKRAQAHKRLKELQERIAKEKYALDPSTTQPLNDAIYQEELLIGKLDREIADLSEKIQQRLNAYGLRLSDMENFAYQVESAKVAWREVQKTKDEISKTFDAAIVEMKD
jgi:conjugal transfer/entry exclusion protein